MSETYFDTSALIKLYVSEEYSDALASHVTQQARPIAIHELHELELESGLRAKVFRKEMTVGRCRDILDRIKKDVDDGLLAQTSVSWQDVFRRGRRVAADVTERLGCRSLDVLHVAAALSWRSVLFVSVDDRQLKAAAMVRLRVLDIRTLP